MKTTSFKFHVRHSRTQEQQGKLFIRVIRHRKTCQFTTPYNLHPEEWDESLQKIIPSSDLPGNEHRNNYLLQVEAYIKQSMDCLQKITRSLSREGNYTSSHVIELFIASSGHMTVCGYAHAVALRLRSSGSERLARAYCSAAHSLHSFCGEEQVLLSDIDAPLMKAFEKHLLEKGLRLNTVSFYMRNIRALYYRATREKLIPLQGENPFSAVFTGVDKTRHRALSIHQITVMAKLESKIRKKLQSPQSSADEQYGNKWPELHKTLLYFMFCYHARGMSFIDMAYLKKQDMQNGCFTYRRQKTGGLMEVKVTKPMKYILSHFNAVTKGSEYVFPLVDPYRGDLRKQYESALKKQNRSLKTLGKLAEIEENLSTHVARHITSFNQMKYSMLQNQFYL